MRIIAIFHPVGDGGGEVVSFIYIIIIEVE